MNKREFLAALKKALKGLPKGEKEERLAFYSEMIDDRMEDGLPEGEAVAEIGSVEEIAAQIREELSAGKSVGEKNRPDKRRSAWVIVLLVLGAPVWLPLLLAAAAVALALLIALAAIALAALIVLWALALSLYAVALSLAVSAVACVPAAVIEFVGGNVPGALFLLGAGLVCGGAAALLLPAINRLAKIMLRLTGRMLRGIGKCFTRRRAV